MSEEQIIALAELQANTYFEFMGVPKKSFRYKKEFPIFVNAFVENYSEKVTVKKRGKIK